MLDKAIFAEGMGQLGGAFGREIDGAVSRMYYETLAPHLTTEQFVDTVKRVIGTETFWPSPAVLLEKAGVSPQQRSEGALRVVSDALFLHGGHKSIPLEVCQSWDAATWAGISAIGGLREITYCTDERWSGMQRRFQRAYEAALTPQTALPSDRPQSETKRLVRETGRALALPLGDRDA